MIMTEPLSQQLRKSFPSFDQTELIDWLSSQGMEKEFEAGSVLLLSLRSPAAFFYSPLILCMKPPENFRPGNDSPLKASGSGMKNCCRRWKVWCSSNSTSA